jgi:iron complex outermembrane receptor protein
METTLSVAPTSWATVSGNYTYQRAVDRSSIPYRRSKILPNRPIHEAHVHASLTAGRCSAFYDYTFEDGNFLDRANLRPVAARYVHDAGVRFVLWRRLRATVECKNIRDSQVADLWGYPLPGRSYFVILQEGF